MSEGINMGMVNDYVSSIEGKGPRPEAGVYVEFSLKAKKVSDSDPESGLPVYKDWEWVSITPAGGNQIVERWVTDKDRHRFAHQYEAFKKGVEAPVNGLAIENWPSASPAEVKTLKKANIRTVEDLAVISEVGLKAVGFGSRALQAKARQFLIAAAGDGKIASQLNHLKVENDSLKLRNEELERQNTELRAQFRVEKNLPNNEWEAHKISAEGDTT
jgi:hypothetical protein